MSISFRCLPGTNVCVTPFNTVVTTEPPEELPTATPTPPPPPEMVLGVMLKTGVEPCANKVPF